VVVLFTSVWVFGTMFDVWQCQFEPSGFIGPKWIRTRHQFKGIKLILLLLVSTDTWQTTKCVQVQWLREGLQNGGHRDPLVR